MRWIERLLGSKASVNLDTESDVGINRLRQDLQRRAARVETFQSGALKTASSLDERLFQAIAEVSLDGVKDALSRGAKLESTNKSGETPLLTAIPRLAFSPDEDKIFKIIEILVEAGANINARYPFDGNWTPLMTLAYSGVDDEQYIGILKFVIEAGADVHATDDDGFTVLNLLHRQNEYRKRYAIELLEKHERRS